MAVPKVAPRPASGQIAELLDSPEIRQLIAELEVTRWTGRPGYPIRAMVGLALAKSLYAIPTWTRTVALVQEHTALQAALGCEGKPPSEWACYRFAVKLREHKHMLDACIDAVLGRLHEANPGMGENVAIDGSDLPAYANGQRFKSKNGPERKPEEYSDPDASWGHRSAVSTRKGGGYYGYKVHAAVDTLTGLPLAWTVETAKAAEVNFALPLIDAAKARGFAMRTAIMDKGYDNGPIHDGCMERGISPVTALRKTERVKRGEHKPPSCEHGVDLRRGGFQAQGDQVALPDQRVRACFDLDQGRPPAPADPTHNRAVPQALQGSGRGRARVRQAQARMGAPAAPGTRA